MFTKKYRHLHIASVNDALSSWCLVMDEWLFLAVPWGCLRFVIVVLHDHTHLLSSCLNHKAKSLDIWYVASPSRPLPRVLINDWGQNWAYPGVTCFT